MHNKKNPHFSVIIPVKNRSEYLQHTLRTCSNQNYDDLEIIVSDDGSTDETRSVVNDAMRRDSRIKYYQHKSGIGMRENFEFALSQIKPGYVIALGGDDGLLPNGIEGMSRVLAETGKELLAWPAPLYSFPGVYGPNGQLVIYHEKGVKLINSRDFLKRQAKNLYYLTDQHSPMFYVKGVTSTRLIDRVRSRSKDGRFYSCPTPDGYSGIVLSGEVAEFAYSGEPFSIYGMSSSSQGLAYQSNDDRAVKESESFFQDASLQSMHQELASQPYSPLITLMTADYLFTAKDLPGWEGEFPSIDFNQLLIKGIRELGLGVYGEQRMKRELEILYKVAQKHGLEQFFLKSVRNARRNKAENLFDGNGMSPNVFYLDAKPYNIKNIFDASYAASNIYNTYSQLTIKNIFQAFFNSLAYKIKTFQKGNHFPSLF